MRKGFFSSGGIWKPKNPHSLEYLKYLYGVLTKNAIVTEQNRSLLVETLRLISEILIWGDQNDSSVFDFFLEKNMLAFFLFIMRQKCGRYVCLQLLQTLNILFENIKNETSLYYLLSNNHVNSIITHRFDFSNEEILAYYISFLKTLSFKLNANTVHFFFNEHNNDYPLYTEAIKFFNHSESMVRIAVRTLTLNVFKINDTQVLQFIRDKTAVPYFSNLVWFIRQQAGELNSIVESITWSAISRLKMLIDDHQDQLHYLHDILSLNVDGLSQVLVDQLMAKLFMPVYLGSLDQTEIDSFSPVVTLFLLTQIFVIVKHTKLVETMAKILLLGDKKQHLTELDGQEQQSGVERQHTVAGHLGCLALDGFQCVEDDRQTYFLLCLLLAIGENEGISPAVMECAQISVVDEPTVHHNYIPCVLRLLSRATKEDIRVRLPTMRLCALFLKHLNASSNRNGKIIEQNVALLVTLQSDVRHKLALLVDHVDTFVELFEEQLTLLKRNVPQLSVFSSDSHYLLPPTALPASVDFVYRTMCSEVERVKKLFVMYFVLTELLADIQGVGNPLSGTVDPTGSVKTGDCINLSNSDLLSCSVMQPDGTRCQQFLVVGGSQLMFVEPDSCKVGWGVVRFVAYLDKCEVRSENDNRALQLMVHSVQSKLDTSKSPLFSTKLTFNDHIRCLAARQRLIKGCEQNRKCKLLTVKKLLGISVKTNDVQNPQSTLLTVGGISDFDARQSLPGLAVKNHNSDEKIWTDQHGPNWPLLDIIGSPTTRACSNRSLIRKQSDVSSAKELFNSGQPGRCRSVSPRIMSAYKCMSAASVEETQCIDVEVDSTKSDVLNRISRDTRLPRETEVAFACEERKSTRFP